MLIKDNNAPSKIPSKKEALDNLRLANKALAEKDRFANQDHLIDPKRAGKYVHWTNLASILKKLSGGRVWTEEAKNNPGHVGFYCMMGNERTYLTACEMTELPEFTVAHQDESGRIYKADRGWREVIMMILRHKSQVITKQQILRFFAEPSNNVRSEGWFKKTQGVN